MKRLLLALCALALAGQAHARGLVLSPSPFSANAATGLSRSHEVVQGMLDHLGGDYRVASLNDAPQGATDALRRGTWFTNGTVNGDSAHYDPIIILGDDKGAYTGTLTASASAGTGILRTATANGFQWLKPGMVVSGNGITGSAVVVGVDSIYQRMTVRGTTAYNASFTLTWRTPVRPDSLTRSVMYPRVTILRFAQFMGTAAAFTTSTTCSTGVGAAITYATPHDSTLNVYDVSNHYRTWKGRSGVVTSATRDPRGWRAILGTRTTRQNNPGHGNGNYDFPDPECGNPQADFNNPDTVTVWMIQNRDVVDGSLLGGDAAPSIYAYPSTVNGTNLMDPGVVMAALALADSTSGGGLFGQSKKLPLEMSFHIDDGWKRGDSNGGSSYGGISYTDTTALIASIDSLAALGIPFVVGVEADSLDSVLLAPGVTGNGRYYDQRWWARAPLAHYTPHCHAGLTQGTNRTQNNATKYLRPLDIFGLSRTRYAFGSVDSTRAGLGTDYVNDVADSAAYYWLGLRAKAMCDSVFGSSKVDGIAMPPGDDWTVTSVKHTRRRQHGLGVDSIMAATLAMGMSGIRANSSGNVVGNDDSTVTNNYGYYPNWKRVHLAQAASGPGMPSWLPANLYGQPCEILPTNGYPGGGAASASRLSWSQNRSNFGGEKFLLGLLAGHTGLGSDYMATGSAREVYVLSSHVADFGSNGGNDEGTRPQFYTFKYVTSAIRTANDHGLRDLVRIVYPEDNRP